MKGIFDNKYWEDKIENIIYIYILCFERIELG